MHKFKSGDRVWYISGGNPEDTGTIRNIHQNCPYKNTFQGTGRCYQVDWDNGTSDSPDECFDEIDLQFEGKPTDWDHNRPVELRKL